MVALDRQPLDMKGMARVCETLSFLGLGQIPVGRKADKPMSEASFPNNPLTGDLIRYMRSVDVMRERPDLEIGVPTVRWAASAFGAMAEAARDDFPGRIKVPLLMLAAARDEVVSTPAIEQLGLRLRTGRHVVIAGARHELFMETDTIRGQVFAAFDAFITEQSS
jgi:lysophospholipase